MTIDLSGHAAALAPVLSCYSTWKTQQFNKKQEEWIESQRRLNALLADKESTERAESKRASLGAAFSKVGSNNYRLKVFNQGPAIARTVQMSFLTMMAKAGLRRFTPPYERLNEQRSFGAKNVDEAAGRGMEGIPVFPE
jgi:hypothetical protein